MATQPGFHPDTNFSEYPRSLRDAISAIGKDFYVTRNFQKETIGNSEYWALLARPAESFSVHLNADRELLFVFADYKNFEIRTLEAFDAFYRLLEQKRVDRSIRFLVSADNRIEDIIKHYLSQNPEYPIIIPVKLGSLSGGADHFLDAVRRNFLLRDLFGYQNPLREETFFFGRQEQVNAVLDLAKSGQSSSIFGLRKSGKTSSIYAIIRRAKGFNITPVFIDCQSPAVHSRRYGELLTYVISEVRKAIGLTKPIPNIEGTDAVVSEKFRDQLKNVLGQAKSHILIIFDEIENISPRTAASNHWDTERDALLFWQNIRSFIQQEAAGRLAICIVGTSPLLLETTQLSGVANPMYLFSQKKFIPAFSFDETKDMIRRLGFFMGLEFDDTKIARLQALYGGHPFFIRQVCSNIHQKCGVTRPIYVSDKQLDSAIEQFGGQLDSYLTDILKGLRDFYPDEFSLLSSIVHGVTDELADYGREAPELIDHLIGYGLVERKGNDFDIRFDAVKQALNRILKSDSTEDFWKECMLRRNELEIEIRREIFSLSKAMDAAEWQQFLESNLTGARFKALPSLEPRVLFSKQSSPLYWTDLMNLVKNERFLPRLGIGRATLIAAMHKVNVDGRRDSHAKQITPDLMSEIRLAFDILEGEFLLPT